NLVIKSEKEYKKENIIEEMKRIEQETSLITDESIPFEEELIDTLMKEKATLKDDMKYETEEEKDQYEKEIEQKENERTRSEEEIKIDKNHVKKLKEKNEIRKEKRDVVLRPE